MTSDLEENGQVLACMFSQDFCVLLSGCFKRVVRENGVCIIPVSSSGRIKHFNVTVVKNTGLPKVQKHTTE